MTATSTAVIAWNGTKEAFQKGKIENLLHELLYGLDKKFVKVPEIVDSVVAAIPDEILISDLYEYIAESVATKTTLHPDYAVLAGRVEASKLQKLAGPSFSGVITKMYTNINSNTGKHTPLITKEILDIVSANKEMIDDAIKHKKDFAISYFGIKTLEKSYLISIDEKFVETPQFLFMRVALGIHGKDLNRALETYNLMSEKYFIHASPTLFNAGTYYNHLSSCFLIAMEDDSIDGIYKTLHTTAMISKASGGIGLHVHNIRSNGSIISSSNGRSNGLVPMLRVFNNTARYVDQGGNKRPGAFAIYIEPWHADIFEVLDLKKNYGKEEMRARDLFYALWIPDLFMEKVKKNEDWCLFSPDKCPGLDDCYGEEFNSLYQKYEKQGKAHKVIPAQRLWQAILNSQTETGGPYIMYKDACNRKSNQKNYGVIKSSNLCCEIVEYSSKEETAVCNLASLALPSFLKETDDVIEFDFSKLHRVAKVLVRNLDTIIDVTKYAVDSARVSNMKHRPIAVGVQGLADLFALLRLPFESKEAKVLNIQIFETIYHAAIEESVGLAKEKGAYETFKGSPASQGLLQFDLWDHKPSELYDDWDILKEQVQEFGIRNSLLVAPMPTASTSQILGFNECFEPFTSNIYNRRVVSGEFQVVNKYLIRDLVDLGIWSVELKDKILLDEGSIQNIPEIPQDIKDLYKTIWEIQQKHIIDLAADRGKFIDQSQSMNIYMRNPTFGKLTSCHFYSWSKGLKTGMYYLRTQAASKATQFTIDNQKSKTPSPAVLVTSDLKRKRYKEVTGTIENKKQKVDIYDDTVRYCNLNTPDCESCSG